MMPEHNHAHKKQFKPKFINNIENKILEAAKNRCNLENDALIIHLFRNFSCNANKFI